MQPLLAPLVLLALGQSSLFEMDKPTPLGPPGSAGEGPTWHPELGILTSGHKGIHQISPDGNASVFLEGAGTNGLLFGPGGQLYACQPSMKRVIRIDPQTKAITVLADNFEGKKFNQPNDLSFDDQGRLYFSDPRYGPKDGMEQRDPDGKTIEGVYRIDPDGKIVRVIGREVERANGVAVSRDGKWLYVADNNNDTRRGARKLWRFSRNNDGSIDTKSQVLLYDWKEGRGPDGLKEDKNGILYVAGGLNKNNPPFENDSAPGGIYVIDPNRPAEQRLVAQLPIPTDEVTNCAFGGEDRMTLYITGGGVLYSVRTKTPGAVRFGKPK